MTFLRVFLASCLFFASTAFATDKTDIYWNPNESGWGLTIANQGDTIFATVYVYAPDHSPTWFTGTSSSVTTDSQGVNTYSGDWYRVVGPSYNETWNPALVGPTKVGTFTYKELTVTTGQLVYSVNGKTITKNVERTTLANNPKVIGSWSGAYLSTVTNCSNPAQNGNASSFINAAVSGTPAAMQLSVLFTSNVVCTLSGPYKQFGRMGQITGTWSCSNGNSAAGNVFEIEAGTNALSARFEFTYNNIGCREAGYLGTARLPAS